MGIKNDLENKLKDAMREQNEDKKRVYRMALSSIRFEEKTKNKELDEESVQAIIQKEIKIRNEMIEDAMKAGRDETVNEKKAEISLLEEFLPKQLNDEELSRLISETVQEVQATGTSDMGKVMKTLLPKVKGLCSNEKVSKAVKDYLANL